MPEGPELYLASKFINTVAKNRLFFGKVEKSSVSKNPEVPWSSTKYKLRSESRGKEIKVFLEEESENDSETLKSLNILIRFGMSGCFKFTTAEELPKHAHLKFFAEVIPPEKPMVLSFVDFRRFGRWEINSDWSQDRGPCPITDYEKFRSNVLTRLKESAFNKPICEVLLNQTYFNGIGNYLRAEILYLAGIPPFEVARKALEPWKDAPYVPAADIKTEDNVQDLLYLCHKLPLEVIELEGGKGYDVDHDSENESAFLSWLRCYQNPAMSNLVDNHGRTIWFLGSPGPLIPKKAKSRRVTPSKNTPKKEANGGKLAEFVKIKRVKKLKLEVEETKTSVDNSTSPAALRAARASRRAALKSAEVK